MKKVLLASMFLLISTIMASCTNDEVETSPNNSKTQITAETGGDSSGQTPISPPKR